MSSILLIDPDRLHVRFFDDETCLVFDERSGATHLLSDLAGHVLQWIAAGSCTEEDVFGALRRDLPEQSEESVRVYFDDLLSKFVELELLPPLGRPV